MLLLDALNNRTTTEKEIGTSDLFPNFSGSYHQMYNILDYLKNRGLIKKRFVKLKHFPYSSKLYISITPSGIYVINKKAKERRLIKEGNGD